MNEAETHAEHIDPALKAAGWGVVDGSRIRREKSAYEITPGRIQCGGKRNKAEIADYVLEYRNRFAAIPFEDKGGTWGARYYQDNAINAVLEAITGNDNKKPQNRILLTLATGVGKTFIAFQLAWKLFQSRVGDRACCF